MNIPVEKQAIDMNRLIIKEEIKMAKKYGRNA